MHSIVFCLILISTSFAVTNGDPSFWDAVPIVSQGKMAFLYVIGDDEEAEQTWNNFKNLTHLWENVKHMDDNIPGYGHIKSAIVAINGDEERAKEIFSSAHKSTCILGGFLLGGAPGAIGGAAVGDITLSIMKEKPVGLVEHALHIENKTASENIDAILDLTLLAKASRSAKPAAAFTKKTVRLQMKKLKITSTRPSIVVTGDMKSSVRSESSIMSKSSTNTGASASIYEAPVTQDKLPKSKSTGSVVKEIMKLDHEEALRKGELI